MSTCDKTTHRQRQDWRKGVVGSVVMSLSRVLPLNGVPGRTMAPLGPVAPVAALPSSSAEAAGLET